MGLGLRLRPDFDLGVGLLPSFGVSLDVCLGLDLGLARDQNLGLVRVLVSVLFRRLLKRKETRLQGVVVMESNNYTACMSGVTTSNEVFNLISEKRCDFG